MVAEAVKTNLEIHDQSWFLERVGMRVFRESNGCGCDACASVERYGLVIRSAEHAKYLHSAQNEMQIRYFEK